MNKLRMAFLCGLLCLASTVANAQSAVRVRGTIAALDGTTLSVKSREGKDVKIALTDKTRVGYPKAITLADIKPGDFVGVAALPDAEGRLVAREVSLFPAALRGTGEGHRPWDLEPGSTMTNANVAKMVKATKGQELSLEYQGGARDVLVPDGIPIVTTVPGDRSLLQAGKYALVFAQAGADGVLTATNIQVEKDGVKPPQ